MKRLKKLLILFLCITCLGCAKESDNMKFKKEYESLNNTTREKDNKIIRSISIDENNPFVYSTCEEISNKINDKETFIIYFGFADCPWCRSVLEPFIQCSNDNKIATVYYVDIKDVRDEKEEQDGKVITTKEGDQNYMKLIEQLSSILPDYVDEKRIMAPSFISIVNGTPTLLVDGISEDQTDGYQDLTDDMISYSYSQFQLLFDSISGGCSAIEKQC